MKRRITRMEAQKKRPNRLSLFLDDRFFCGVDAEVAAKLGLAEGRELDEDEIARIALTEEEARARTYSFNLLSYRMRSRKELAGRLGKKGFSIEVVEGILEDLEAAGLVDDLEFARSWMRSRMESSPRSYYALRMELARKGVDKEKIEQVGKEMGEEFDEKEAALSLARKRLARLKGLEKKDADRRLYGFLTRRGFNYGVVKSVLAELKDREDDVE